MKQTGSHAALESRVNNLEARIVALKHHMEANTGREAVDDAAVLSGLEERHRKLEERLHQIDLSGPGISQSLIAEFTLMADDLASAMDDLVGWIDAGSHPGQRPGHLPKP